jgi:hypothetical protein
MMSLIQFRRRNRHRKSIIELLIYQLSQKLFKFGPVFLRRELEAHTLAECDAMLKTEK